MTVHQITISLRGADHAIANGYASAWERADHVTFPSSEKDPKIALVQVAHHFLTTPGEEAVCFVTTNPEYSLLDCYSTPAPLQADVGCLLLDKSPIFWYNRL